MAMVLVEPPTETESEQETGMNQANRFISSRLTENFLVARVVNDKTQLSEDKRKESGVAKLGPRIVKSINQQESADQQDEIEKDFSGVIGGLFCE